MANKKGRIPPDRGRTGEMLYRSATFQRSAARDEDSSIPMVLATETPIPVYDINRKAVVMERLMLEGLEMPPQVPMIDTHDRSTVRSVLGSIRDLKIENSELVGRAYFASDQNSQQAYRNYRDGHLTDFSVGAPILEARYDGNAKDVVRSRLIEGSAVVAGMDPNAKAMVSYRAYADPYGMRIEQMKLDVLDQLIKRGLPPESTDEEAEAFLRRILEEPTTPAKVDDVTNPTTPAEKPAAETEETDDMATPADTQAAVAAERKRVTEIDELCRTHGIADETRRTFVNDETMTVERASVAILKAKSPAGVPVGNAPITPGQSEREKFYETARAGFITRAVADSGRNPREFLARVERIEQQEQGRVTWQDRQAVERSKKLLHELNNPVQGAEEFRYASIPDIARMMLERAGERHLAGLPKHEIVRRAIQLQDFVRRASDGPAYHTTGSFSHLLLDAANKTLLAAYDETEVSYPMWVRTAPSASDFKQLHRIRFGELADPEEIPENEEYPEKGTSDARESYAVTKKGAIFSISFEAMVNDDLNAITRIPAMQGFSMRRKINKDVYRVLTDNAALSDGIALFHATSHGENLDATALAEAALDVGFNVMAKQTGLSTDSTALGLRAAFLIVPFALGATSHRLTSGMVMPVAAGSTVPLYGEGRKRPLTVVEEPQLDLNSATAWYLAASSNQTETVEVTFLQGEESPVLERENGFSTDTIKYKIRQTYAAKAIDYRGLYQGNS